MTQPTESDEGSPASEPRLFDDLEDPSAQKLEVQRVARAARRQLHPPRLREPNRQQVELRASDLESLLARLSQISVDNL